MFGFAVALAFVFLLSVYIRQELSVDGFHVNKDRIFRLEHHKGYGGFPGTVGSLVQQQFPEVECFSRFLLDDNAVAEVSPTEKVRYTLAYVDPAFFRMFSFPLTEGRPESVMREKRSMVLTRSLARKLFGSHSPIGQSVTLGKGIQVPVTGVMEDMPENTHFPALEALVNIENLTEYWDWKMSPDILTYEGMGMFSYYLMGKSGTDLRAKETDILACFQKNLSSYQRKGGREGVHLEPLESVYFSPFLSYRHNSRSLLWTLSSIAFVILVLAVINYINLSVAQGGMRAKEMSVKKLLGSSRSMLFRQFISESVLLCLVAGVLAVGLALLLEPEFNRLLDTRIEVRKAFSAEMLGGATALIVLIGIVSGAVPALVVTRFNAIEVMKGAFRKKTKGVYSKALICLQYTVAIALTIGAMVLMKQTRFMLNYDLGFNRNNLARFSYEMDPSQKEALRHEVMNLPGVKELAFVNGDPVDRGVGTSVETETGRYDFKKMSVDTNLFRMLGIKIKPTGLTQTEGPEYTSFTMRNGKMQMLRLRQQSVWLNEEAVKKLELEELPLEYKTKDGKQPVRGVVGNFHIEDLSQTIAPLVIVPLQAPEMPAAFWVQLQGPDQLATFRSIQEVYKQMAGIAPYEASFVGDALARWYERTERMAGMIGHLCLLAILLSAMGILAMATFFIQQRVKEIGIRRVNGATIREILQMLMNGFMKWIVVAFVVACPLGYYVMNRWLSDFAYRTSLDWWIFALSGILALLIAALMICWQSWRAASTNPVEILKME